MESTTFTREIFFNSKLFLKLRRNLYSLKFGVLDDIKMIFLNFFGQKLEYKWLGNYTLARKFNRLYAITTSQNIIVAEVLNVGIWSLHFRRSIWGTLLRDTEELE